MSKEEKSKKTPRTKKETTPEAVEPVEQNGKPRSGSCLKEEAEALHASLLEANDRLLRTAAEFDNYRKRTEKEKQAGIGYGCGLAIERFLPVLDTLERAANAESKDPEYKKGVLMTLEMFKGALHALGVEEIPAEGLPFNPDYHSAISKDESGQYDSGVIVSVLQKGYKREDRILRHAMVIVAE